MLADKLRMALASKKLPVFVSAASQQNTGNSTVLSIASPAGVQAGDLLIAFMMSSNTGTSFAAEAGWTEISDVNGLCIKYKVAADTDGSASFDASSSTTILAGSILAFRDAAYDTLGSYVSGSGSIIEAPQITTSIADCMLLGFACKFAVSAAISNTALMTPLVSNSDSTSPSWKVFGEDLSAAGTTGTRWFDTNGSGGTNFYAVLLSIKPA